MKIKRHYENRPTNGDTRHITLFLLWPVTIQGETRWLEKARINQSYNNTIFTLIPRWENLYFSVIREG